MSTVFSQISLPSEKSFRFGHSCSKCKKYAMHGMITYSYDSEDTKFICKKCLTINSTQIQLPKKSEFRNFHKCKECNAMTKFGVITYCSSCEVGEFVCPNCIKNWFANRSPNYVGITRDV